MRESLHFCSISDAAGWQFALEASRGDDPQVSTMPFPKGEMHIPVWATQRVLNPE